MFIYCTGMYLCIRMNIMSNCILNKLVKLVSVEHSNPMFSGRNSNPDKFMIIVPQGSVLGPPLFLIHTSIYEGHVRRISKSIANIVADDSTVQLYICINSMYVTYLLKYVNCL